MPRIRTRNNPDGGSFTTWMPPREAAARLEELSESAGELTDDQRTEMAELERWRADFMAQARSGNPSASERIDNRRIGYGDEVPLPPGEGSRRPEDAGVRPAVVQARDGAMRAIERHRNGGYLTAPAADRLDVLVRRDDPTGLGAEYLAAVGDDDYCSAFFKMAAEPQSGHLRFSQREVEAVRRVTAVQAQRAVSYGGTGGFPVPFVVDPSVLLTSSGAINPIRDLADHALIAVETWKGVSADSPVVGYSPENTEASDNSPVLVQPTINLAKGQGFCPFSIEIGQDWVSIVPELTRLLMDARDIVDATMFLTGTGAASTSGGQPGGVLNIGGTGGLTTTQRIQTTTTAVTALGDVYAIKQSLGNTRFMEHAVWVFNSIVGDTIFRFVASGSTVEPQIMPQGRGGPLLGKPFREWSTMTATPTVTGSRIAIFGDWSGYKIVDHLGASVEFISHLFGPANHYPTGQRGLYMYWRTGAGAVKNNALRYLEVKLPSRARRERILTGCFRRRSRRSAGGCWRVWPRAANGARGAGLTCLWRRSPRRPRSRQGWMAGARWTAPRTRRRVIGYGGTRRLLRRLLATAVSRS